MPNRGPVYQPTTESYGQQGEWRSPSGLLAQTTTSAGRSRCLQWVTLGLFVLAVISGVILVAAGSVAYSNSEPEVLTPVVILVIGIILLIIGCILIGVYVRQGYCRTNCLRTILKEKRIAHQMRDSQSVNGQTMNPSTDFLVSAQYAPVSEIAYQPPAVSDEEETRKLMGSDNKDCNEDSERILDKDPRIVLRPLSKVVDYQDGSEERFLSGGTPELNRLNYHSNSFKANHDHGPSSNKQPQPRSAWKNAILRKASVRSKRAPLAGFEDITPSLRSSWSSMYFNQTPSESESDGLSYASDTV
ncbi:hypothetical protein RUM43_004493 [Polyplax serrata]|uniref:Uncharacterized protein n=1 Tax=Polyplax serrata TaxID=468196 RepID=A0AAN8SAW7_POLSC